MSQRARWLAAGSAALALVLAIHASWPEVETTAVGGEVAAGGGRLPSPAMTQDAQGHLRLTAPLAGLPASLRDTAVDGELTMDAAGNLVLSAKVRAVFDYFLAAVGEEPLATIIARIRGYIALKLTGPAVEQANRLLDGYLAYREALGLVPPPATGLARLEQQRQAIDTMKQLRRQHLPVDTVAAFFGEEEAYDEYTWQRLKLADDKSLAPAQRRAQEAALLAQLPAEVQQNIQVLTRYQRLNELTAEWKQRGGNAQELRVIREQEVGAAAADRLEALDRQRAQWEQRMSSYLSERERLLRQAGLSEQDKLRALDQLRSRHFQSAELLRVLNLETLHDQNTRASGA